MIYKPILDGKSKNTQKEETVTYCHFSYVYPADDTYLSNITQLEVERFRTWLTTKQKVANATANKHVRTLSQWFERAVQGRYIDRNPCKGIRALRVERKRHYVVTKDDITRIMRHARDDEWRLWFYLAFAFGFRPSTLKALKGTHFDLGRRIATIPNVKAKREYAVPIPTPVNESLRAAAIDDGFIFPNIRRMQNKYYYPVVRETFNAAGLPDDVVLKDFRKTVGAVLVAHGVHSKVSAGYLDHSTIQTNVDYYSQVDSLQPAADVLATVIPRLPLGDETKTQAPRD